jgi:hypothetical protein
MKHGANTDDACAAASFGCISWFPLEEKMERKMWEYDEYARDAVGLHHIPDFPFH